MTFHSPSKLSVGGLHKGKSGDLYIDRLHMGTLQSLGRGKDGLRQERWGREDRSFPNTLPGRSGHVWEHAPEQRVAPGASVWPFPRQTLDSSPDEPAATTGHVVSPLASSTHEVPSLRESGEQHQHQENEPHVHTAAADEHRLHW